MTCVSFTSSFECVSLQTEKYIFPAASHHQFSIEWKTYAPFSIVHTGTENMLKMFAGKMVSNHPRITKTQRPTTTTIEIYETGRKKKKKKVAQEWIGEDAPHQQLQRYSITNIRSIYYINNNNKYSYTYRCMVYGVLSMKMDVHCARKYHVRRFKRQNSYSSKFTKYIQCLIWIFVIECIRRMDLVLGCREWKYKKRDFSYEISCAVLSVECILLIWIKIICSIFPNAMGSLSQGEGVLLFRKR